MRAARSTGGITQVTACSHRLLVFVQALSIDGRHSYLWLLCNCLELKVCGILNAERVPILIESGLLSFIFWLGDTRVILVVYPDAAGGHHHLFDKWSHPISVVLSHFIVVLWKQNQKLINGLNCTYFELWLFSWWKIRLS